MTNEQYLKAIDMRRSRRSYRSTPLSPDVMDVIRQMVDAVNQNDGLHFIFIEDATSAFSVFTGKFSMIVVAGDDSQKVRENCGYYGESIVLQCVYHGLGTCWVTGTYNENRVYNMIEQLPDGERVYGVITIGYVKDKMSTKEKLMYNATHKQNRPYQKMFEVCDVALPDEFKFAMQLVEKAPSAVNRRPVKFRYENGVLSGYVKEPYSDKSIDFGIAKLHFDLGCRAKGINGEWTFDNKYQVITPQIIKLENSEVENDE